MKYIVIKTETVRTTEVYEIDAVSERDVWAFINPETLKASDVTLRDAHFDIIKAGRN